MRYLSTDTMNQIVAFVDTFYRGNGFTPTIAEIATGVSLSGATVHKYLHRMDEAGQLSFDGHHIITPYIEKHTSRLMAPVSGAIACGTPGFAEQEYGEEIILPPSLGGKGDFFILTANGMSMKNIGIETGDMVVIRKQNCAEEGEIVAALVRGDEATLKRYTLDRQTKEIVLQPENEEFSEQRYRPDEVLIQGVAVYVMKKIGR